MESQDAELREEETYPFLIDHIPEEYLQKAEKELNETPENSIRLLQELKSMTKNDKSLEDIDFHDDFLRQYLRHSKHDVRKALNRLKTYVKFRSDNPSYFENVDIEQVSKTPDYTYCTPLPWRCRDGCPIFLYNFAWHPDNISVEDLFRLGLTLGYQELRNPVSQINGIKLICDWKSAHLYQLKYMTPRHCYRAYQAYLASTPARIKEIHMVNESLTMKIFWTIFKPFLPQKLKGRYIFHSSPEDLLNYFPKHVVPAQFGGDLEVTYMEDWMRESGERRDYPRWLDSAIDFEFEITPYLFLAFLVIYLIVVFLIQNKVAMKCSSLSLFGTKRKWRRRRTQNQFVYLTKSNLHLPLEQNTLSMDPVVGEQEVHYMEDWMRKAGEQQRIFTLAGQ